MEGPWLRLYTSEEDERFLVKMEGLWIKWKALGYDGRLLLEDVRSLDKMEDS